MSTQDSFRKTSLTVSPVRCESCEEAVGEWECVDHSAVVVPDLVSHSFLQTLRNNSGFNAKRKLRRYEPSDTTSVDTGSSSTAVGISSQPGTRLRET